MQMNIPLYGQVSNLWTASRSKMNTLDDFLLLSRISIGPLHFHPETTRLTSGDINHRLEHQRHCHDKHHIVDKELRCVPVWRRSAAGNGIRAGIFARSRSRVGCSFEGSGGGSGESSIQGIEGVDSSEPGEKRSHLSTSIAHAHTPPEGCSQSRMVYGDGRSAARSSRGRRAKSPNQPIRIRIMAGAFEVLL